jgi:uncharacterized protein (DUF1330 family)
MQDFVPVAPSAVILVVTLTVRRGRLEELRTFEHRAAQIMIRYGGQIERAVLVDDGGAPDLVKEVHIVRFPSDASLQAYREDEDYRALAPQRDLAVAATEVWVGVPGPEYGTGDGA